MKHYKSVEFSSNFNVTTPYWRLSGDGSDPTRGLVKGFVLPKKFFIVLVQYNDNQYKFFCGW